MKLVYEMTKRSSVAAYKEIVHFYSSLNAYYSFNFVLFYAFIHFCQDKMYNFALDLCSVMMYSRFSAAVASYTDAG